MKKLKCKEELPEWFNIKKYHAAEKFGYSEFLTQLFVRKLFIRIKGEPYLDYTDPKVFSMFNDPASVAKNYSDLLNFIREHPVDDLSCNSIFLSCCNGGPSKDLERKRNYYLKPIHSITPNELQWLTAALDTDKKIEIGQNQIYSQEWAHEPITNILEEHFDLEIAAINLSAPDDVLKEQFEKHLAEARKRRQMQSMPKIRLTTSVLQDILPYLDLTIWAQRENKVITNQLMAAAIYPIGANRGKDENSIRRTLALKAKQLLKQIAFDQLQAIIGNDLAQKPHF